MEFSREIYWNVGHGVWALVPMHLLLVMGFFIPIPFTKFRHILPPVLTVFFEDLGPKGKLVNIDFEDEDVEIFGVATVGEMTWKDMHNRQV